MDNLLILCANYTQQLITWFDVITSKRLYLATQRLLSTGALLTDHVYHNPHDLRPHCCFRLIASQGKSQNSVGVFIKGWPMTDYAYRFVAGRLPGSLIPICELWINNRLAATILPSSHHGICVLSAHTIDPCLTYVAAGIKRTEIEFSVKLHAPIPRRHEPT